MKNAPEGLLLLDKPEGPTSHDMVERVRRLLRQPKVGHAGTLDPPASGLLPLLLGRATRLLRYLPHSPKAYEGTIRLGITTSSDDVTGEITGRHVGGLPGNLEVRGAASRFVGSLSQLPPAISARKVGGKRLYRLARAGRSVEAPPSQIQVFAFQVWPGPDAALWLFRAEVSAGTYIRALARDLGQALGCGAALERLCRVSIGPMRLDAAVRVDLADAAAAEALHEGLIPLEEIPLLPPPQRLGGEDEVRRFAAGLPVHVDEEGTGTRRVLDFRGRLLGIGEASGTELRPKVVLAPREGVPPDGSHP